jgi:hypothetical protein
MNGTGAAETSLSLTGNDGRLNGVLACKGANRSPMRLSLFSLALVSTLGFDMPAYSAPVPEQSEALREAYLVRSDALDSARDPLAVAFRLQDWLDDNGSGGFPPNFSDEDRRSDPWEDPPQ